MAGLFKIVVHSWLDGQASNEYVNVFGYRSNIAVINEELELAAQFKVSVVPTIRNIITVPMKVRRVEVYNVSNGSGYYDDTYATPLAGLRAGETMPQFTTWGFRYNRITAGKRHGYKRIGPISESDVAGDLPTAGMLTVLNTAATALGAAIKLGAIDVWFPEILERKPTGVFPWTSHPILNCVFQRITTQNSRKIGA